MRKVFAFLLIFSIFSCAHPVEKTDRLSKADSVALMGRLDSALHKKQDTTNKGKIDTLPGLWEAIYVADMTTLTPSIGPVKMAIAQLPSVWIDTTTIKGKKILGDSLIRDTVYIVPWLDSLLVIKDQKGNPIRDANGRIKYGNSFRKGILFNKSLVHRTSIYFPNLN